MRVQGPSSVSHISSSSKFIARRTSVLKSTLLNLAVVVIFDNVSKSFYFMEMNTRLQVEHPVTEAITGLDLVSWQLLIASGLPLPLTQSEIATRIASRGHAIEARIYAEKPAENFMPDSGTIVHLRAPKINENVRIDAGFVQGDAVSESYDGMIAKLIVRGEDREKAIRRMGAALEEYEVVGLSTNVEFLKRICKSLAFLEGEVETGFIEENRKELFAPVVVDEEVFVQAALELLIHDGAKSTDIIATEASAGPHGETIGFGNSTAARSFTFFDSFTPSQDATPTTVTLIQTAPTLYSADVLSPNSEPRSYTSLISTASFSTGASSNELTTFFPHTRIKSTIVPSPEDGNKITIFQGGKQFQLLLETPAWMTKALGKEEIRGSVVAPMPCRVLSVKVEVGERVKEGQSLVVWVFPLFLGGF